MRNLISTAAVFALMTGAALAGDIGTLTPPMEPREYYLRAFIDCVDDSDVPTVTECTPRISGVPSQCYTHRQVGSLIYGACKVQADDYLTICKQHNNPISDSCWRDLFLAAESP